MRTTLIATLICGSALAAGGAAASQCVHFGLTVLMDGTPRPEYAARGTTYVEAVRGREYAVRLTNPLPVRVAVALAVDGLNTIDAGHSDAANAAKWVLDPYESVVISGWQTSGSRARRFYFTGERDSYGAKLGQTANLGVIEAVFFKERSVPRPMPVPIVERSPEARGGAAAGVPGNGALGAAAAPSGKLAARESADALSDRYAATGIGRSVRHDVQRVYLDLEPQPAARVRIRYEFRAELVRLGVLAPWSRRSPLDRREAARGFADGFCPDPAAVDP